MRSPSRSALARVPVVSFGGQAASLHRMMLERGAEPAFVEEAKVLRNVFDQVENQIEALLGLGRA